MINNIFLMSNYHKQIKVLRLLFVFFFLIFANYEFNNSKLFFIQLYFFAFVLLFFKLLLSKKIKYIFEPPVFLISFTMIYEIIKFPYYLGFESPESLVSKSLLGIAKSSVDNYYITSIFILTYTIICTYIFLFSYRFIINHSLSYSKKTSYNFLVFKYNTNHYLFL